MKKSRKRTLAVIITVLMLLTAGTGCSKTQSASGGREEQTVTVWTGHRHSKLFYEKMVNEFNRSKGKELGVKIDYQVKADSYQQLIRLALESGDAPDMFIGFTIPQMVENKYIVPINDLPGGEMYLRNFTDYIYENENCFDGKTYALPVTTTVRGLIYNKDMFKAAGIVDENGEAKPPTTYEEMREYAKKLTKVENMEYGIILPLKWITWFVSDILQTMQSSAGFWRYSPVEGRYDLSSLVPIIETFLGVREDGSFFPGAEDIDNDPARALFANGNIGMKFAYSFDFAVLTSQFPASCDWGVAPLPVLDANASYKQIAIYDYGLVINSQAAETKDKELLMEVWKFFNSEELARLSYQEGINLPLDWNTIKDIDLPDEMRQWQDFAQLLEISAKYNKQPRQETGAEFDEQNEFLKKVWSGEETAVDYVKRFEEQLTLATQLYYEANPDEKLSDYNDADWDISR